MKTSIRIRKLYAKVTDYGYAYDAIILFNRIKAQFKVETKEIEKGSPVVQTTHYFRYRNEIFIELWFARISFSWFSRKWRLV